MAESCERLSLDLPEDRCRRLRSEEDEDEWLTAMELGRELGGVEVEKLPSSPGGGGVLLGVVDRDLDMREGRRLSKDELLDLCGTVILIVSSASASSPSFSSFSSSFSTTMIFSLASENKDNTSPYFSTIMFNSS